MQRFSSPVRQCSTLLGRLLLEWYCSHEDYFCMLSATKPFLADTWRHETVRSRQNLAHLEYPRLSITQRKARLLDDLWPQLALLIPQLIDILAEIPKLSLMEEQERLDTISCLQTQAKVFYNDLIGFTHSRHVCEVLKPAQVIRLTSTHDTCCPPLPFTPCTLQFPPAGYLRLRLFSIQYYLLVIINPLLYPEIEQSSESAEEASYCANEICRTYAGLEIAFDSDLDLLMPCCASITLAGMSCPPNERMWIWYKLAHFEQWGPLFLDPIKKAVSIFWDMPNIATEGFSCSAFPEPRIRPLTSEDIDLATRLETVDLDEDCIPETL